MVSQQQKHCKRREVDKPISVGLVYDLRSEYLAMGYSEDDVAEFDSEETVSALDEAIVESGYHTERIGNCLSLFSRLASGQRWDLVFNIAEGLSGCFRESQVPSLLEMWEIGYTFSDPFTCAVTLDKSLTKRMVRDFGIPTPKFEVIEDMSDIRDICLEYPLFAKPVSEGTGKGINDKSLIESPQQLAAVCEYLLNRFAQPVLVEQFLPGREFTVGILENGSRAYVLGIMEIEILHEAKGGIYSYFTKERCEELVNYVPYREGSLHGQLAQLALKSYKVLRCRDAARVDFRCDGEGTPYFLEINPLPGLHPTHSDLPMIATQQGLSYRKLIDAIIESALSRLKVNKGAVCKKAF